MDLVKGLRFLTPEKLRDEARASAKPIKGDLMKLVELVMGDPRGSALEEAFAGVANELISQNADLRSKVPLIEAATDAVPPGMKWLGALQRFELKKPGEMDKMLAVLAPVADLKAFRGALVEYAACAIALCMNASTWWSHALKHDFMEEKQAVSYMKKLGGLLDRASEANNEVGRLMPEIDTEDLQ